MVRGACAPRVMLRVCYARRASDYAGVRKRARKITSVYAPVLRASAMMFYDELRYSAMSPFFFFADAVMMPAITPYAAIKRVIRLDYLLCRYADCRYYADMFDYVASYDGRCRRCHATMPAKILWRVLRFIRYDMSFRHRFLPMLRAIHCYCAMLDIFEIYIYAAVDLMMPMLLDAATRRHFHAIFAMLPHVLRTHVTSIRCQPQKKTCAITPCSITIERARLMFRLMRLRR